MLMCNFKEQKPKLETQWAKYAILALENMA